MKKNLVVILLLLFAVFAVQVITASAEEYPGAFKIKSVYTSTGTNFHFRIFSDSSSSWHCYGGPIPAWSYINETDSGAKGKILTLLTAYYLEKIVRVITEGVDSYAGRVCRIKEVIIE